MAHRRRLFGSIERRRGIDEAGYEPPDEANDERQTDAPKRTRYEIKPMGLVLACIGALGMAVAVFLPVAEPENALALIQGNTLIQQERWDLLVAAGFIVIAAGRSYSTGRRGWATIVWGLLGLALTVYLATNKELRTLYPVGSNGHPDTSLGTVVPLGVAVYVAGAGALLAIVGGLTMRQSAAASTKTKPCPDCAESVLAAAHVCKHCGHRFAQADALLVAP